MTTETTEATGTSRAAEAAASTAEISGSRASSTGTARGPAAVLVVQHEEEAGAGLVRVGSAGWAVQFHPEADGATVAEWAAEDGERMRESGTDPEATVTTVRAAEPGLRTVWGAVAEAWGAVVRARADARR
ncbi:hypothetical protein ACFY8C_29370 [Streptomyces flavochromogenes]|uniref:Uncharacterized protein n=1 Tax=Streptomyces flavochromogenes TaxID=68199 RepID=A0ABW6XYJ0_9ACTN